MAAMPAQPTARNVAATSACVSSRFTLPGLPTTSDFDGTSSSVACRPKAAAHHWAVDIGWIPSLLEQVDDMYLRYRWFTGGAEQMPTMPSLTRPSTSRC